jgi:uncharacterized protein (TIGR00730 family)
MAREQSAGVRITVFASSTPQTAAAYQAASAKFGRLLAREGHVLVFGGGNAGCMGSVYEAAKAAGGRVHGITHRMFVKKGGSSLSEENAADLECLEIVEGSDLTMRKRRLLDAGDCLVALPGGVSCTCTRTRHTSGGRSPAAFLRPHADARALTPRRPHAPSERR